MNFTYMYIKLYFDKMLLKYNSIEIIFENIISKHLNSAQSIYSHGTHQSLKSEKSNPLRALRRNFNNVLLF